MSFFSSVKRTFRLLLLKRRLKGNVKIASNVTIDNCAFEGMNSVAVKSVVVNSSIGRCSYIGPGSTLINVKMGRFCSLADNISVVLGNHPTEKFVSTHPAFYYDTESQIGFTFHRGKPIYDGIYKMPEGEEKFHVVIGNDVWIGSHVQLLGGITIGDGAVIASGAVVTRDVEPYSVYGGVPAKLIKYRFKPAVIDRLLLSKWWEKPVEDIACHYKDYCDVQNFLSKMDG